MKYLPLIFLGLVLPLQVFAAPAFEQGSALIGNTSGTSFSTSFGTSCTGSNQVGIVTGEGGVTNNNWTTVTWGGTSMTKIATEVHTPGDRWSYAWYAIGIPSGAQTVVVNGSPSDYIGFTAACYSGLVAFDSTGDATSSLATSQTSATINLTTTQANEWVIGGVYGVTEGGCSVAHTTVGNNRVSASVMPIIDNTIASLASVSITCNPAVSQSWSKILGGFLQTLPTTLDPNSTNWFSIF